MSVHNYNNNYPSHSRDSGSRQDGSFRGSPACYKFAPPPPVISREGKKLWDSQHRLERDRYISPHSEISPQRSPETEANQRLSSSSRKRFREDQQPVLTQVESVCAERTDRGEMNASNDGNIFSTPEGIVEFKDLMDQHRKQITNMEEYFQEKILKGLRVSAEKMVQLEEEKKTLQGKNADLTASLKEAERTRKELNEQIEALQLSKINMENRLKQKDATEMELRANNTSLLNELKNLKGERDNLNLIVANLEERLKKDGNANKELQSKLTIAETENQNLRKRWNENEQKLQVELRLSRDELNQKIQELKQENSAKSQLEKELEKLKAKNEHDNKSLTAQLKESEVLKQKLARAEQNCENLCKSLKEETEKLKKEREMSNTLTQETTKLNAEILDQQYEINKHKTDLKSLNQQVENLNLQLEQCKEQAESDIEDVYKGFMEKVNQQESLTTKAYESWCHTSILDRTLNSSNPNEKQSNMSKTETPRTSATGGRQGIKRKELNTVKRPLQKSFKPNKKAMSIFQKLCATILKEEGKMKSNRSGVLRKTFPVPNVFEAGQGQNDELACKDIRNTSPEPMEELEEPTAITSPAISNEAGIQDDSTNEKSPTPVESQIIIRDKTVITSAQSKPSAATSVTPMLPKECRVSAAPSSSCADKSNMPYALRFSNSIQQEPIPTLTVSKQSLRSREFTPSSQSTICKWCKDTFSTPTKMAKHHCAHPQDPRLTHRKY